MGGERFEFEGELWEWDGPAAWHFVALPPDLAELIRETRPGPRRGFGSVRVEVVVGGVSWRTSIFPDSGRGTYLLPVKQEIRRKLDLADGSVITVDLTLR